MFESSVVLDSSQARKNDESKYSMFESSVVLDSSQATNLLKRLRIRLRVV